MTDVHDLSETDVAVVGMAGHFPGAADVDQLWQHVVNGDDCLRDLSVDELVELGVSRAELDSPTYVRRGGTLDQVEYFDPEFFGIGPRDAAIMDPQHRHFMECAWEALEAAGIVPERFDGAIGVFGGCGMDTYLINNLLPNANLLRQLGWFLLRHTGNDKDFLTTTVSYRLDLRGPSVNVQTACSTSLVAVHLAVQSLLAMECDVALAGGSTIEVPHGVGYEYHEGEVLSPDGYCRAFDLGSGGTVLTSGAGVVALRRLTDAWDDGDPILAVIKGSAINNDGARKVSYLAPSVDGHADVVKEALTVAGVSARSVQLLEAHGTGTPVGDPIEVAALTEAFRATTDDNGFCRLTSTKPNIGHLDTAAGVASLIKVVQAMRHETLPPIANHTGPSALLDIDNTPFVLSSTAMPWPASPTRRAGVSSLGVGGTNAHVVVEDAPSRAVTAQSAPEQVLMLSGRDAQAVDDAAERLARHLESHPGLELADVAHTLATRRRHHHVRRVVTATDVDGAVAELRRTDRARSFQHVGDGESPRVAFLFPGGGAQYPGMAGGFDERFSTFHDVWRDGSAMVRDLSGVDLDSFRSGDTAPERLSSPSVALPSVFLTSLGLARQWMAWGVQPDAFIGHSLGEYVAAQLAGVLTFEDAVKLVVCRAGLVERIGGDNAAMLVVPLGEASARQLLTDGVSLATVNTDDECVLAGRRDRIVEIERQLLADDTPGTLIPIATAGHSVLLDPILDEFRSVMRATQLNAPQTPFQSNFTGTWITAEQATDPDYWVNHLRHTVRFADNLRSALSGAPTVTVELGPGQSLSSYARRCVHQPVAAIAALRHPRQEIDDSAYTLQAFGQQWAAGVPLSIEHITGHSRAALTLPTYPFQRRRFWFDAPARSVEPGALERPNTNDVGAPTRHEPSPHRSEDVALERLAGPSDMWWTPGWAEPTAAESTPGTWRRWWVVAQADDLLAGPLCDELTSRGYDVRRIEAAAFAMPGDGLGLADHDAVLVVGGDSTDATDVDAAASFWLGASLDAVRLLGAAATIGHRLALVSRGAVGVDAPARRPVDAMALAVAQVTPREYPDLDTILIDLDGGTRDDVAAIVDDVTSRRGERVVALRDGRRLVPTLVRSPFDQWVDDAVDEPVDVPLSSTIVAGSAYVVTGGLGAIGHTIALHLAARGADLAIVTSSPLPAPPARDNWLRTHGPMEPTSQRLRRLAELEATGARVAVVVADLARPDDVRRALDETESAFGRIDGAIHAAGSLCDRLIGLVAPHEIETVVGVKARGAITLASELHRRGSTLLVLISSTSTALSPAGQVAYVASNAVLDALAGQRDALRITTLGYGVWSEIGMAQQAAWRDRLGVGAGDPVAHPIFEELISGDGEHVELIGHLSATDHWVLADHRTADGHAVLPGTGHLELMVTAVELAKVASLPVSLGAIAIHEALAVPDDARLAMRVSITTRGDRTTVELESDGGADVGWRLHSSAMLLDHRPHDAPPHDSHGEPAVGFTETDAALDIDVMAGQRENLRLGPRWSTTATATFDDDRARATIALDPELTGDLGMWRAHPAMVDAGTGVAAQLVRRALGTTDLLVPIGYDEVTLHAPVPADVHVAVNLHPASGSSAPKVDLQFSDRDGRTLLTVDGLQFWLVAPGQPLGSVDEDRRVAGSVSALTQLAEGLGIRPHEGVELFDQLLVSRRSRMVASSVDLERLMEIDAIRTPVPDDTSAATPAAGATGGQTEATVLQRIGLIWSDLLGVADPGADDNFFDLGGHSLIAIRLMSRLQRELGVRLQLTDIFDAPSLGTLSKLVEAGMPAAVAAAPGVAAGSTDGAVPAGAVAYEHRALVQISAGGDGSPLFIVHGAGGNVLFLWSLARAMSGERSVFGFQAAGTDARDMPDGSIEAMARRYVAELRAKHAGPYLLGGYSGGGVVAMEMVRQLTEFGDDVSQVFLFDSVPPGRAMPGRSAQARNFAANVRRAGWASLQPFLRRKVARVYRTIRPRSKESLAQIEADERALGIVDVGEVVNLFSYFSATAERYEVGRYEVDVTVLKADHVWPVQPYDYYWTPHVDGQVEIRTVPGDHHSMFYPELVPQLAGVMRARLDEIESAGAGDP